MSINTTRQTPPIARQLPTVLSTDGVSEAHNAKNKLFGDDRLIETLKSTPAPTAESTIAHLSNALTNFVGNFYPMMTSPCSYRHHNHQKRNPKSPGDFIQNDINELIKLNM